MRFFLNGISALLVFTLAGCWLIGAWFDLQRIAIMSMGIGLFLAWLFVSSGFFSFYRVRAISDRTFRKIFISSIFGRLLVMAVILVLMMRYATIHRALFLVSLFCGYFIFQIWEIISLNRLALRK